jgi:hypothetical protein
MLERVSKVRGLTVAGEVRGETVDRPTVEKMIRAKTAEELPPDVLEHETEALVALGLIAPSYDAQDGMFGLVGTSVTGFYEPANKTMYLMTDVPEEEQEETLAHELVHALQDQHYDLGPLFKYKPDDDERVAAGHALAEGDATSAALDVVRGDRMGVPVAMFAALSRKSIEALAPDVPAVLRESLVAPYVDGYAFVQALRRRGDDRAGPAPRQVRREGAGDRGRAPCPVGARPRQGGPSFRAGVHAGARRAERAHRPRVVDRSRGRREGGRGLGR